LRFETASSKFEIRDLRSEILKNGTTMRRPTQFDEVMIVNPSEGSTSSDQRVRLMRFHNIYPPELSGFAEPDPYGYYSKPETYGYYAQPESYGYYAQPEPYGYFAEDPYAYSEVDPAYGYYGEMDPAYGYYDEVDPTYGHYAEVDPTYGYYAQAPEFEGYGYNPYETMGYAQIDPDQMGYYSNVPEMVGYGEQYPQDYPGVAYYGEPDYSGYVRERPPAFNAGCPLPINVAGYEEGDFAGYVRPATVNATCDQLTEQPGSAPSAPDTFKPLW
jgi:hypothetical protein